MKELFVIDKPNSTFGEEIKKTRTNLMYSNLDDDMRIVMIFLMPMNHGLE